LYYVYVFESFGLGGMGSRLASGCMRSGGCGLVIESVASWGRKKNKKKKRKKSLTRGHVKDIGSAEVIQS
jgi:hypothetical protein